MVTVEVGVPAVALAMPLASCRTTGGVGVDDSTGASFTPVTVMTNAAVSEAPWLSVTL